jgi:hypothetical protein
MSAASIIGRVRASGGDITLAGDNIKLMVPVSLYEEAVAEVRAQRGAVRCALKNETEAPWDAEDYHALYEERAGIGEYDGCLSRAEAEAQAFECCIIEWLNRHPDLSAPGRCAWCGRRGSEEPGLAPFGTEDHGHTWLHDECWQRWHQDRRRRAAVALMKLGLPELGARR